MMLLLCCCCSWEGRFISERLGGQALDGTRHSPKDGGKNKACERRPRE